MKEIHSSKKVADFLHKNMIHKVEFAKMIGVTLSYVYNLLDDSTPFSSRATTLERIATVMDILPEEFDEYIIQDEPIPFNQNLQVIKDAMKQKNMTTVQFLKKFEPKKRLKMVDILRGAKNIPIDLKELLKIGDILDIRKEDILNIWMDEVTKCLDKNGFNSYENSFILDLMFRCVEKNIIK